MGVPYGSDNFSCLLGRVRQLEVLRSLLRFVCFTAIPVAFALGACDDDVEDTPPANAGTNDQRPPGFTDTTPAVNDAGAQSGPDTKHGLCGATSACSPDNDGTQTPDGCATAPDAGLPAASYQGCHVTQVNGTRVPRCEPADPLGVDGTTCAKSADCAPGFDCVEGDKGPVCRRYCCSGSCDAQLSRNGGSTFCDVGKLTDVDQHMVPVCMPIKACKLLNPTDCGDKETCAVVNDKGSTSCVPKGDAKVGDACDETHCDSALNCLGNPGDRHCYKLCHVDGNDCGAMETCTTGSVFKDTTFGVCKAN